VEVDDDDEVEVDLVLEEVEAELDDSGFVVCDLLDTLILPRLLMLMQLGRDVLLLFWLYTPRNPAVLALVLARVLVCSLREPQKSTCRTAVAVPLAVLSLKSCPASLRKSPAAMTELDCECREEEEEVEAKDAVLRVANVLTPLVRRNRSQASVLVELRSSCSGRLRRGRMSRRREEEGGYNMNEKTGKYVNI